MCDTGNPAHVAPVEAVLASAEWKGEVLPLEPVDELSVLTVCDNVMDLLLPDQGPAKRLSLAGMTRQAQMVEALGGRRQAAGPGEPAAAVGPAARRSAATPGRWRVRGRVPR
jgi:hypothetical protein